MKNSLLKKFADNIRVLTVAMVEKSKSGHPGGAMGGADFISVLYSEYLKFDHKDGNWLLRDRFFLDPGHMSPMLYSMLYLFGNYSEEDIKQFRQWQSCTPGHPELDKKRGIENTSGPLGQGHVMAVGSAIAERFFAARFGEWMAHKTFTFISDGGIQEEISQGAGRIAGYLGLSNLIMFYDSNDVQLSTNTDAVTIENTAQKYESWGWKTITIDGNNIKEIRNALDEAVSERQKPIIIIGKTIMGKGLLTDDGSSFEGRYETHVQPVSNAGASVEKSIKNLGGDINNPFAIFPEIAEVIVSLKNKKETIVDKRNGIMAEWEKNNSAKAKKLHSFFSNELPTLDLDSVEHQKNIATRSASANLLAYFSKNLGNMLVASADLSNSDKTDAYLQNSSALEHKNFKGKFLHAGVSELTMASIMNGMALHGGLIPVGGTFFVFSDYMKPAIRMAALMELPVIYVFTHDAFRVGEDGPTHQPVEHEMQLRLMELLKNHSGRRSMLVLRPADAAETTVAWQMALDNKNTPTALVLSRQNVNDLPSGKEQNRQKEAKQAKKGAYIVNPTVEDFDVVLLASGSEVGTLVDTAMILDKIHNIKSSIVSVISEALFREQSEEYQQQIIPADKAVFGLTAGLPITLQSLVGGRGEVFGLDHFGYSAPAKVLDEKFGFMPGNIAIRVIDYLKEYNG